MGTYKETQRKYEHKKGAHFLSADLSYYLFAVPEIEYLPVA